MSQGTKHGDQCVKNGLCLFSSGLGADLRGNRGLKERQPAARRESCDPGPRPRGGRWPLCGPCLKLFLIMATKSGEVAMHTSLLVCGKAPGHFPTCYSRSHTCPPKALNRLQKVGVGRGGQPPHATLTPAKGAQSFLDPKACVKPPPPTQAPESAVGSLTEASPTCLLKPCMGIVGDSRN